MKLLNNVIAGAYTDKDGIWELILEINTHEPDIYARIKLGDSFADTQVNDAIELGIWLWQIGIVGKDVDKLIDEVDAAQMFCFACC